MLPNITPAEARARGLNWCFTGNPCKYGHVSKRRITAHYSACLICYPHPLPKICITCGGQFLPKHRAKTCSKHCSDENSRKVSRERLERIRPLRALKKCVVCNNLFTPRRNVNACSDRCRELRKARMYLEYSNRTRQERAMKHRIWYKKNRHKVLEYHKQHYLTHYEKLTAYCRQYNKKKSAALRLLKGIGLIPAFGNSQTMKNQMARLRYRLYGRNDKLWKNKQWAKENPERLKAASSRHQTKQREAYRLLQNIGFVL